MSLLSFLEGITCFFAAQTSATSGKENLGSEELKQATLDAINWDEIPCRTTEVLFKRLKEEIIRLKDEGRVLMRFNELRETLQRRLSGEFKRFADEELRGGLKPAGRKTIAQRFNAGFGARGSNESRRDERTRCVLPHNFFRPFGAFGPCGRCHPPLKRWAIIERPCGTSEGCGSWRSAVGCCSSRSASTPARRP